LNALFQANLGRLPTEREASIYSKDFGGTFSPELEAAFMSRSTEEMGNRQKGIKEAADAAAKTETAKNDSTWGVPTNLHFISARRASTFWWLLCSTRSKSLWWSIWRWDRTVRATK
jgi:hypothetical protein